MSIAEKLLAAAENVPLVFAEGKQAECDRFWDEYQQNGERRDYTYAFAYYWTDAIFQPKHPIVATNLAGAFMYSEITALPEIDATAATNCNSTFFGSKVKTIAKLKVSEESVLHTNMFSRCVALEEIEIEGTIAASMNFSFSSSLTVGSLQSILASLQDFSDSGETYTMTLGTKNLAKLTDEEKAIATEKGWTLA